MIRKVCLAFGVCLTFLSLSVFDKETILPWHSSYKLEWSDFNGIPISRDSAILRYGLYPQAVSAIYLDWVLLNKNDTVYTMCAFFDRSQSWHIKDTENLLQHEQLHFDIAELFARKVRAVKDSLKKTQLSEDEIYNHPLVDLILTSYNSYDERYDRETGRSLVLNQQTKWNKVVKAELEKASMYEIRSPMASRCAEKLKLGIRSLPI